jgi:hypothetical protein
MYNQDRTLGSGGGTSQGDVLKIVPTTTPTKPTKPIVTQDEECFSYGMFTVWCVVGLAIGKVLFTRN